MHREPIITWSLLIGGVGEWDSLYSFKEKEMTLNGINQTSVEDSDRNNAYLLFPGLALPVVVPPVREFLGFGNIPVPKNPPPVKDMIAKAKA